MRPVQLAPFLALLLLAAPSAAPSALAQGTRRALLIGCGEYPLLAAADPERYAEEVQLAGPSGDVALMGEVLVEVLDFERANVRTLVGWPDDEALRPTRARILDELAHLARVSAPGDFVVVHFSGHGTQQPARERDTLVEPDGLDEVLLPADVAPYDPARGAIPGAIRDDELGASLAAIRDAGAEVWLVVDACHSGSLLRGESQVRLRGLEPERLGVPPRSRRVSAASAPVDAVDLTRIAAFHGAQSYGRAPEFPIDTGAGERHHGLFTWLLAQELVRTGGAVTYAELIERVVAAYQAWPCRITVPGASGGDLTRALLAGAAPRDGVVAVRDASTWRVPLGRLAGVVPGARFALADEAGTLLGQLVVASAGPFEAFSAPGALPELAGRTSANARLVEVPLADPSLAFAFVDASGDALPADELPPRVRDELLDPQRLARYPLVAREAADWWLVREGAEYRLRPRPGAGGADVFLRGVEDAPAEIARIARAQNLVRLAAAAGTPRLPEPIELAVEVRDGARSPARRLAGGEAVRPGAEVRVRCTKRAGATIDLNLFYVDAHHGVTRLFPAPGGEARLAADVEGVLTVLDWTPVLDTSLGLEHVLAIAQVRDPSDRVLDLASLAQASVALLRHASQDRVAALLVDLASAAPSRAGLGSVVPDGALGFELVTLDVRWREPRAPAWPTRGVVDVGSDLAVPTHDLPSGVPSPVAPHTRRALLTSDKALAGDPDVAFLGDDEVHTVLLDLGTRSALPAGTPSLGAHEVLGSPRFAVHVAFRFDGARVHAYYGDGTNFHTVLVDEDGDGLAETCHRRRAAGWSRSSRLAVDWLSQAWSTVPRNGAQRQRALRALSVLDPTRP
jgi:hypothetical protein